MKQMQRSIPIWLLSVVTGVGGLMQAQGPTSPRRDFQINSYTSGLQHQPEVVGSAEGRFVVVWESAGSAGSDDDRTSIQGQLLDALSRPIGAEFQVNDYTTSWQDNPAVAIDDGRSFVVVWESFGSHGSDDSDRSIQARIMSATGAWHRDQFQVNTATTLFQISPRVAMAGDGSFVVVWKSKLSLGEYPLEESIRARRFGPNGDPLGLEFQVDTYDRARPLQPDVTLSPDGSFMVVWSSHGSPGDDNGDFSYRSVQGRRFDASGTPVGSQFQINTYTTSEQARPLVASDGVGDFIVVWNSLWGPDGPSNRRIEGQRISAEGIAIGGELQLSTFELGNQNLGGIQMERDRSSAVVWKSRGSPGTDDDGWSIQGRWFADDGAPLTPQFQINTYTSADQEHPSVASSGNGRFMVVWTSEGSAFTDTDGFGIQGRIYQIARVFNDDFESGDVSVWSDSEP